MTTTTTTTASPSNVPVEEVAGFRILRDARRYQSNALQGKTAFGNLDNLQAQGYVGLAAMSKAVDALPRAETVQLAGSKDGANSAESLDAWRLVRNEASKTPFYVSSDSYAVINAHEALHPLLDACQEAGLHIAGTIDVKDDGARIKGFAVIGNQEAVIEVLRDTGDFLLMGFKFEFRHDGTSAVRITPAAVRVVCSNTNLWGEFLPAMSLRHIGSPLEKVKDVAVFLRKTLALVPSIKEKIDLATAADLTRREVLLVALGAGLAARHVAGIHEDGLAKWEPGLAGSMLGSGLSVWLGYNALTAYASHSDFAGNDDSDGFIGRAAAMLDGAGLNDLLARGREKAKLLSEKRAAQVAAVAAKTPKARVTVPAIPGITT